jgi:phosphoglycerol transferase
MTARALSHIRAGAARMARPLPTPQPLDWTLRPALLELAILWLLVTAVLAITVDFSHVRVPFGYGGDSLFYSMNAQAITESGWMQGTDRLGAPFGQDLHDFPLGGDNGNYLIMKVLALFTHDTGLLLNIFFLGSFYLVASSAWLSTRLLGGGGPLSLIVGLLYAFAFFHFNRLGHLMLANYWAVPIGVVLAVYAARGQSFASLRTRPGAVTSAFVVLACIVVGSFGAYYAIFAAMTVVIACLASSIGHRTSRPLLHGAAVCAGIGAVLVVNLWSSLAYMARNGENPVASLRGIGDLDLYGLRLIELIRPIPWSRVDVLRPLFDELPEWPNEASTGALGLVGTVAFLGALCWLAGALVRRSPEHNSPIPGLLVTSLVAWLLIASNGGLFVVAWLAGFEWMRALNRSSILVLFLALAWAAVATAPLLRASWQGRRRPIAVLVVTAVAVVGLADQIPPRPFPNSSAATAKAYWHDQNVFAELEDGLPRGAAVLQLPVRHFPGEAPRWKSADYDMVKPYLHTKNLRFSYAGVQGREQEWQLDVERITGRALVQVATAMGFDAILIDRWGYPDGAVRHREALVSLLGDSAQHRLDDRWLAFDLTRWRAQHRPPSGLRATIMSTPRLNPGDCAPWIASTASGELPSMFKCPQAGSFFLTTPRPTAKSAARLDVRAPGGAGTVTLRWNGRVRTVRVDDRDSIRVVLPVGKQKHTDISFSTSAPPANSPNGNRGSALRIRPEPAAWVRGLPGPASQADAAHRAK